MKRNISRVLIILLLIISIPFCCVFSFPSLVYDIKRVIENDPSHTPDPLEYEITDAFTRYENEEIPFVDFLTLTPFEWDRLYVIGGFSSYKKLTYKFGISWMSCNTNTNFHDGWAFLVFVSGRKIVRCFDYAVYPYNLSGLAGQYPDGIPAQDAVFISHGIDDYVELVGRK